MIHYSSAFCPPARSLRARLARFTLLATALLWLAGCSWFKREDPMETLPVDAMYSEAKGALQGGNLGRATRYYQRLIARFPYGVYTEQAQLELAYTQYRDGKSDDALSTINRFIKTYPAQQNVAYAYYLKALVNFDRDRSVLDRLVGIDSTLRDQGSSKQSFDDFAEVIRRFPSTRYAQDARQRMVYLRNQLARYEINVARYYLRREAYVAASQRAEFVIENYARSEYQSEALAILAESYRLLGQDTLAKDTRRVLELNDPEHPYLHGDWPSDRGWLQKLMFWRG